MRKIDLQKHLCVGIDVGSTTLKVVVLEGKQIIYKVYERHFSDIAGCLKKNLSGLQAIVGERSFAFAMTGSAGMGVAQRLGLPFVQEVIAAATAVKQLIPQTDTMVELGGEDAKLMYFGAAPEERMNGVCAGGTGAFIDHMASLLHTDAEGLNKLALQGKRIYTIASRCGVFAKTDIQALMNEGTSKEDIAKSIFQAVVNQTIGNLAQGREISGRVAFLGGPLYFLSALKQRFVETLQLAPENIVEVENGAYFVAEGCALAEEAQKMHFSQLTAQLDQLSSGTGVVSDVGPALFQNQKEYEDFMIRHQQDRVPRGNLATYVGPVYVGVDAGSTTTKIVAMGQNRQLLYTDYGSNQGQPLQVAMQEILGLYAVMPKTAYIAAVLTTGYGEKMVQAALHADFGEVETFAHYRAALEFCPQVSCVLDIGGQDMKCFLIHKGNIEKITLNEACSAGCGSFVENFAEGLGLSAADFAQLALRSRHPVDLGTRCTVFMNSKVKQAQKEGAPVEDISAGICLSIIKNALFKVMQLKDAQELGDHVVVQGGTFYNDAILRHMEKLLGRNVIRPDIAGLMGAYGAAILAQESKPGGGCSTLLSREEMAHFKVDSVSYRCGICGNHCLITRQTFPDGSKFFTGNRCERGEGKPLNTQKAPNIYAYKQQRLFHYYQPLKNAPRGRIGIPRALNMYEDYPFWATFFKELGYEVVLSAESSAQVYYKGMSTIPSDSLCYPAKMVHGHIMDLVDRGLKTIFYPCLPYNMQDSCNHTGNHFNCPVVASYGENIRNNMDILAKQSVKYLHPFLPISEPRKMELRLAEVFAQEGVSKKEIKAAVTVAYAELEKYKEDVRQKGGEIIKIAEEKHLPIILLVGRPYHLDKEINHGLDEMIQSYNLAIVSEDAVYHMDVPEDKLYVVNQWSYHDRLYHAARFATRHPQVHLIQLSSFGCGLDAITANQVRELMEEHQQLYTLIKLDEVNNLGAARIRLRSLLAVIARRTKPAYQEVRVEERAHFTPACKAKHTILAPQMSPIHFDLVAHALNKYGYQVVIPQVPRQEAIDTGLKYVNNDMCYPAIVTIGQLVYALQSGQYDADNTSIVMFQTCGACRATNYLSLLRRALQQAGYQQVPVFACWGLEQDAFRLYPAGFRDVAKAIIYGDLLQNVTMRMSPYEARPGSTAELYEKWRILCKEEISYGSHSQYRRTITSLVQEFDALPLLTQLRKPKVGVVGEILAQYHPVANNNLVQNLLQEGAEVVLPDLTNFLLYMAYDGIARHDILDGSWLTKVCSQMFIRAADFMLQPMREALEDSVHFTAPVSIYRVAELASQHVSLANMAGEGWLLPGEMTKLLEEGVKNIVCVQPWGCLPNHILGKGVFRELRRFYADANLVALDCDASVSEVNQLNRLKLMLAIAKEQQEKAAGEAN